MLDNAVWGYSPKVPSRSRRVTMKSKIMYGAIVLVGILFLQACKDVEAESTPEIPSFFYYECAMDAYRNGWYPENECVEEDQIPTKVMLEMFAEAERDYNIEQIEMFEYEQQQLAQQERERQLAEEQQRQREEAALLSKPDYDLEWFGDDAMGFWVEGWKIVALEDEVTVREISVNRGNCKVTLGVNTEVWPWKHTQLPSTIAYGKVVRFSVPNNCNVREIAVSTSRGSWVSTFTR